MATLVLFCSAISKGDIHLTLYNEVGLKTYMVQLVPLPNVLALIYWASYDCKIIEPV